MARGKTKRYSLDYEKIYNVKKKIKWK